MTLKQVVIIAIVTSIVAIILVNPILVLVACAAWAWAVILGGVHALRRLSKRDRSRLAGAAQTLQGTHKRSFGQSSADRLVDYLLRQAPPFPHHINEKNRWALLVIPTEDPATTILPVVVYAHHIRESIIADVLNSYLASDNPRAFEQIRDYSIDKARRQSLSDRLWEILSTQGSLEDTRRSNLAFLHRQYQHIPLSMYQPQEVRLLREVGNFSHSEFETLLWHISEEKKLGWLLMVVIVLPTAALPRLTDLHMAEILRYGRANTGFVVLDPSKAQADVLERPVADIARAMYESWRVGTISTLEYMLKSASPLLSGYAGRSFLLRPEVLRQPQQTIYEHLICRMAGDASNNSPPAGITWA